MILLDTHAWVQWVAEPESLSDAATDAIEDSRAAEELLVSSISVWEVALLVSKGRLELTLDAKDWIARAESLS